MKAGLVWRTARVTAATRAFARAADDVVRQPHRR
jgi:hypothetical protein